MNQKKQTVLVQTRTEIDTIINFFSELQSLNLNFDSSPVKVPFQGVI